MFVVAGVWVVAVAVGVVVVRGAGVVERTLPFAEDGHVVVLVYVCAYREVWWMSEGALVVGLERLLGRAEVIQPYKGVCSRDWNGETKGFEYP